MLVADTDTGVWVGLASGLGVLIGAIGTAIVAVINGRARAEAVERKAKEDAEDQAAARWGTLFDRQEKRVTLLEAAVDQGNRALQASNEVHNKCLVRYEQLWGLAVRMVEDRRRLAEVLAGKDVHVGPGPELPHRDDDPESERAAAEFRERTALHDSAVLKNLDRKSQP